MDNYNSSFTDMLNSSSTNNDSTSNPTNPQNPIFPQQPNYPQNPNAPPYTNYPPHPNFPQYGNYPPNPNYHPYQPFPHQNYQPFPQQENAPVRPNRQQQPSAPTPVVVDDIPTDTLGRRTWTSKEEEVLVGAFLTASVDPILGNDQKAESFWRRITSYFNANIGSSEPPRGVKQCKNKYHAIMQKVSQFVGFYNNHASHWQSGASDEQIMFEARADYKRANKDKPFRFEHIWRMVRDEPKWKQQYGFTSSYQPGFADSYQSTKKTRVNEAGDYTSSEAPETPASGADSTNEFPTQPLDSEDPSNDPPPSVERRPMGQKAAKRKAKGKGKVGEASQTTAEMDNVAEFYDRLQLSIHEHTAAIREKNEAIRERNAVAQAKNEAIREKARDTAFFKLMELEEKDTSAMTPAIFEKHISKMKYIREKYGFE